MGLNVPVREGGSAAATSDDLPDAEADRDGGVPAGLVHDRRELRLVLGQFPTGVTVVTCVGPDGPVGMTANSLASVSLDPPLVLWSLARDARSFAALAHAERFAFSVLSTAQIALSARFSRSGTDKFLGVRWQPGLGAVPLLGGASAHIECVRHAAYPGGDHLIVVGMVERFARHDADPLVFAQGRYGTVAGHPEAS